MLASLDRAPSARIFDLISERTYRVPHRITTILMTRFLLELQAANSRDLNLNHDDWIFSSRQIDDDIASSKTAQRDRKTSLPASSEGIEMR